VIFNNITSASDAANEWYWTNKSKLSQFLQEKFQGLLGPTKSSTEVIAIFPEIIYSNKEILDDDALQLAVGLFSMAIQYNFFALGEGRGQAIIFALKRDLNIPPLEGVEWPNPLEDPEKKIEFIEPPKVYTESISLPAGVTYNA
jgi:hypothetical protein